jgi:hypothetical protein
MRQLIALVRLLFWKPRIVVSTPPAWEPNSPKQDGYNWIPVGNIREPIPITLLYNRREERRLIIKSAHTNRQGVIYLDCEEGGNLRRIRADYVRTFVDATGHQMTPREFLADRLLISLWERAVRAKAPNRGWGRGGLPR